MKAVNLHIIYTDLFISVLFSDPRTRTLLITMGVANTMAALRETWWIPKMRTMVKKEF